MQLGSSIARLNMDGTKPSGFPEQVPLSGGETGQQELPTGGMTTDLETLRPGSAVSRERARQYHFVPARQYHSPCHHVMSEAQKCPVGFSHSVISDTQES